MNPLLKLLKSNDRRVRLPLATAKHPRFFFPLALCLLSVAFYIPPHAPRLAIAQTIDSQRVEANQLYDRGRQQQQSHQYQAAIQSYNQALAIYRAIRSRRDELATLGYLGLVHLELSNYDQSIEYTQQALAIARETQDPENEANALLHLGITYRLLGNYAKAIEYTQQGLAIVRERKDRHKEGVVLGNLSIAYTYIGDYDRAFEYAQQGLKIAQKLQDREGEGAALSHVGVLYSFAGRYSQAIEYLQQSLAIARELKNRRTESRALGNLGVAYKGLGKYAQVIQYTQQWLAIAREIQDRQGEAIALRSLGDAYFSSGNYTKTIEYMQQSLALAREIHDRQGEGMALNNLGAALLEVDNLPEAEKMLLNGIQVWESMRQTFDANDNNKVLLFEGQARTYRTLQQVRVAQNQPSAALEIAERGRARAFVDLLTQRLSPSSVNRAIATAPNQSQIRQIAKAQNAALVQYSIIYDNFQIESKDAWRESALYIWVISPTGEITFRQVDLKPLWQQHKVSLADLIVGNQEFFAVRSRSAFSTHSQPNLPTLHQLLIDPIATLLPKDPNAHVIFIPQGLLFQVPFPALQDSNGTYLIRKHTIRTAPSIQVLALTRQQQQRLVTQQSNNRKALVLGNPTMPSVSVYPGAPKQRLSPLPGAEIEAKAIASLLTTQPIIGAQGTKAAIVAKMPQASIIHLATHGLLDDVRGLESAIALAPSGNDDGLLTAEEILNMKLQADLVVLSACNTAQGRTTGDGIIGLSRSLISAGVPSVVVSLWAVPDAPTAELMQAFYQNLQKNPDKAQALRQAMLATMRTHSKPRDWAAFTLIGEAE
ncbi:CHAT domain-containing protein [Phormidesmis sp. 146-33]